MLGFTQLVWFGGSADLHCKKGYRGKIILFLASESLVSDIPDGGGKMANLFLQCLTHLGPHCSEVLFKKRSWGLGSKYRNKVGTE